MDWELASKLLDVIDGAHGHPKLKALEDEAQATLADMAAEAQKLLDKRKQEQAEADAKAQADAAAKAEPKPAARPAATFDENGRRA